jgi:hypothetical protein
MGRPKGSKNRVRDEKPAAEPGASAQPAPKLYSDAFKGMSFGKTTSDSQEVFQIRLVHPTQAITHRDVLDFFAKTKHARSFFGLNRHEKDLVASFHTKEAREDFITKRILTIGKAEVHVAPFPAVKQPVQGAKYFIYDVPMTATGPGLQKDLHSLSVERFIFEKYANSQVRTGRVLFWTTASVPTSLYIAGSRCHIKRAGLPNAPPNTPASVSKEQQNRESANKAEESEVSLVDPRRAPETPTIQAQRKTANLAEGTFTKRKEISPLLLPPAKAHKTLLETEAPFINAEFLLELGFKIPTNSAVLSIYENVRPGEATAQALEIPSPLGKNKTQVKLDHSEEHGTEDLFNLTVNDGSFDEDTIFHYEGSYKREAANDYYAGMRWVQRFSTNGTYILVLFKSRIYLHRNKQWQ